MGHDAWSKFLFLDPVTDGVVLPRLHLNSDEAFIHIIDRLPQTGGRGIYLKQQLADNLIEHRQYINKHGQDMPEIRNWK